MKRVVLIVCGLSFIANLYVSFDRPSLWSVLAVPLNLFAIIYLQPQSKVSAGHKTTTPR